MLDHLNFGTIGSEDIDILLCDLWIDETTKTQTMVGAHLCQPDSGIAGAAFDDEGIGIDLTSLQCPFNDGDTGTVLGAAARVQPFQLCEAIKM
jgi:hypothetical protein